MDFFSSFSGFFKVSIEYNLVVSTKMSQFLQGIWTSVIEYETPRLVKIHNRKLGLARRLIQISIITYVLVYALFLQKGYQEFTRVESSVTVKIKGVTKSELGAGTNLDQSKQNSKESGRI